MATCPRCDGEMNAVEGCAGDRVIVRSDGESRDPIPYGEEENWPADPGDRCHDCGVVAHDGNHHHPGCDVENCPFCGGQYLSCSCRTNEDEFRLVGHGQPSVRVNN